MSYIAPQLCIHSHPILDRIKNSLIYTTIDLRWQPVILILFVIIILFINFRTVYSILFYYY